MLLSISTTEDLFLAPEPVGPALGAASVAALGALARRRRAV